MITMNAADSTPRLSREPVAGKVGAAVVGELLFDDGLTVVAGAAVVVVGKAGPDS